MTTNSAAQYIAQQIAQTGPIPFSQFMQAALYAPGCGYYVAGQHKLGKSGDFYTAPEISPIFGASIATEFERYLAEYPTASVLELGPGSGKLAHSILSHLSHPERLAHYYLLEVSPDLQADQQAFLHTNLTPELRDKVSSIQTLPSAFNGIIIANEVADAMPVERFQIQANIHTQYVDIRQDQFTPFYQECTDNDCIQQVHNLGITERHGYESEINLALASWMGSLSDCLTQGMIYIIDYGYHRAEYYHAERHGGTLKCFYQQRVHDNPFTQVGMQDITAHVDFTTIAEAASTHGLSLMGFCEQSHFLLNLGIASIAEQYYQQDPIQTAQAFKLLAMPSQMGAVCKAIGLAKNIDTQAFLGFSNYNKVGMLSQPV